MKRRRNKRAEEEEQTNIEKKKKNKQRPKRRNNTNVDSYYNQHSLHKDRTKIKMVFPHYVRNLRSK